MRELRVRAPIDVARRLSEVALQAGARTVSVTRQSVRGARGESPCDVVAVEGATPVIARVSSALHASSDFDPATCSMTIRELRAIVTDESAAALTVPLPRPRCDVAQELWQATHVTWPYAARVLVAAGLLAYGLLGNQPLPIIAGLLFVPTLAQVLGVAHGLQTRDARLVRRGLVAISTGVALLALGAALVGAAMGGPVRFDAFPDVPVGVALSAAIGFGAALAAVDDVGRRELIGLATSSQLSLAPAWFGLALGTGTFDAGTGATRGLGFALNLAAICATGALGFALAELPGRRS